MNRFLPVFLLCLLALSGKAQDWKPYRQLNNAEILHEVQKLGVTGSALYIAAHPDDENTRVLAWLANEKKVRTAYLSLTRGDGGQNLIGTEQGEALGILRTQELLAARRIDGAEQFFTRAYDFGFSKNPEETFRFWNKDSVLSDVVWVIRKFQPDIIITRFPTTGEGGHGHHTASAILAAEAFDAAADPKRFPEQLKFVQPWQAKRLFWNTYNFGSGVNTIDSTQLKVDVGGYNALLGKSYGEIAAEARTMHKSQGFGTALQRGSSIEYFKQLKGDVVKNDLFEGIDLTWGRFSCLENICELVKTASEDYDANYPQSSIPILSDIRAILRPATLLSGDGRWSRRSYGLRKVENLLMQCAGIYMEANSDVPATALETPFQLVTQIVARNSKKVIRQEAQGGAIGGIHIAGMTHYYDPIGLNITLRRNEVKTDNFRNVQIIEDRYYPSIHWLKNPRKDASFSISPTIREYPELTPDFLYNRLKIEGDSEILLRPFVTYKTTDPVKGEIYQPLQILPEVTLDILANSLVFENYKPKTVFVKVRCHADSISGVLELDAPTGWAIQRTPGKISLRKGKDTTIAVRLTPNKDAPNYFFRPTFVSGDKRFNQHARLIHYSHIPDQTYLSEAKAYVTAFPLQTGGKNLGYINGAGDEVPEALRNVGYTVTMLDEKAIQTADLSRYDAIVTGVRAYNTQDWLQGAYPRLMDYVKKGGNLVVQYNTNSRIGPVKAQIGPDSFTITRDRVTDENATVTFLAPRHPALNTPNKITADDFTGWIQERSIYHASAWASSFTPILSMGDAGEKPSNGSLIVEPYGKGNFVYTGLVFFRQLPAGIPGAYRLFANLLALPNH